MSSSPCSTSLQHSLNCLRRCGVGAFDQMPVAVERDARLAVANPAADGEDVDAGAD